MGSAEATEGGAAAKADPGAGRSVDAKDAEIEGMLRTPMTGWYSPFKLAKTATDIAVSALLGPRGDFRLIEALGDDQALFDYTTDEATGAPRRSIWIDYLADTGDGFNPTFTIASLVARSTLEIDGRSLPRGDVLVMGGDQVYPSASREGYQQKLVRPFEHALLRRDRKHVVGDLFAIPGNHDWYDGLIAFMRLFGQGRTIASWRTRQSRSYFALKLPCGFWLLGVDIQLSADMDRPQIDYFCRIAEEHMKPGDQVILCTPEPDWVVGKIYDPHVQDNLAYFERTLLERRPGLHIAARIAGDLHHYRRHASAAGDQNFIAGGGGAFLHPTHGEPVDEVCSGPRGAEAIYRLQASFPTPAESRRLAWRNLGFLWLNRDFSIASAVAYAILSLLILRLGIASLVGLLIFLAFIVLFTDTSRLRYRLTGGLMHGLTHAGAALGTTYLIAEHLGILRYPVLVESLCDGARCFVLEPAPLWKELSTLAGAAAAGALVGPILLGIYLLASLNGFRRHANEAFSSLRIQDYKNFLRMHIEDGKLTIYPVGVRQVPRRWKRNEGAMPGDPLIVPTDREITPHLIEAPIVIGGD